ncbi:MAG: DUF342 domain-containing protein [Planctomycetes bacterium]|nr:DUF342 domain-containing protein [Planctomycetota bacterium]
MAEATTEQRQTVEVVISDDKLEASIRWRPADDEAAPTRQAILEGLEAAKIEMKDAVVALVDEFLESVETGEPPHELIVARGRALEDGKDEEFVWDPVFDKVAQDWQDDAAVNYYTLNSIVTVEQGATIGTITPAVPPKAGVDVLGRAIDASRQPSHITLADSVSRADDDAARIVACVAGRVVLENATLSITEVLHIPGDVNFKSGNVDAVIDVVVNGLVEDGFVIKTTKSVTIGKAVQAATVHAERDVIVRGGIVCRGIGRVSAGGEVVAKFCSEANVRAGTNIKIAREVIHSFTHAEESLLVEHGAVIGGTHYARQDIAAAVVGSDANVPTRILLGIHPRILEEVASIDTEIGPKREAIERIRGTIKRQIANIKRLTSTQKEQATELLFKADEAELEVTEAIERKEQLLSCGNPPRPSRLLVGKTIYAGVTVAMGYRSAAIIKEMNGPVSIEIRKVNKVTEMVAVNQLTGSIHVLQSRILTIEELLDGLPDGDAKENGPTETADHAANP